MRAAFLLVVVGLAGCGDDGGDAITLDEAPGVFRSEYCRYLARCGAVPDVASCIGLNTGITSNVDPSLRAAIEAGKIDFDGGILGTCYHQIGDLPCDRTTELARTFGGIACYGAALGTIETGSACAFDDECRSGACDAPDCPDACCEGACIGPALEPPPYPIGAACVSLADCASGSYCRSATHTCTALLPEGSPCDTTSECAYGLGCAGAAGSRVCKALPVVGEACPDNVCRDTGTVCNASKVCAKAGLPGDACTTNTDCSTFYVCDATKHCADAPHEGESCAVNPRCADYGNFCESTTKLCTAPQPDGARCTFSSQCASDYCGGSTGGMTCQPEPVCI